MRARMPARTHTNVHKHKRKRAQTQTRTRTNANAHKRKRARALTQTRLNVNVRKRTRKRTQTQRVQTLTRTRASLAHFLKCSTKPKEYPAHSAKVHSVGWSCDGRRLASGSYDKTVTSFTLNEETGRLSREFCFKGHADSVDQLSWHPLNPDLLTTASGDKTVKVWDAKKNREITSIATKGRKEERMKKKKKKKRKKGQNRQFGTRRKTEKLLRSLPKVGSRSGSVGEGMIDDKEKLKKDQDLTSIATKGSSQP